MVPTGFRCEQAREYISLELDGELSELERERLRMHLAQCSACARYARDVRGTTSLLRSAPLEPVAALSSPVCEQARQFVSLDLDGELSETEREWLGVHLSQCSACAQFSRNVAATTALLRSAPLEMRPTLSSPECEQARQYVSLDLDGEFSDGEREQLDLHLANCSACAQYARDVAATTSLLRDAPLEQLPAPIEVATIRRPRRRRVRIGAGAGAAVAAMLVLGVGVSYIGGDTQSPPPVPFDGSALGDRQNWDGVQSKPIALRHAAPGLRNQIDPT